jgi:hypothetical protein
MRNPRRVKQGGSKKSFGMNNWHSLEKSEKAAAKGKIEEDSWVVE